MNPILDVDQNGLSVSSAAIFIIGELAGIGVLALPYAFSNSSWWGIFLLIFCCIIANHTSVYLAKCWLIIEENWPEYQNTKTRNAFATIGERAIGKRMKSFCSFLLHIQMIGVCVVFLLLCAELTKNTINSFLDQTQHLNFCTWIIIFGLILIPFSWFGSPEDFKYVAFCGMTCTVVSCILLIFMFANKIYHSHDTPHYKEPTLKSLSTTFGTILFAFGGSSTFPTFQNDMKNKKNFPKAVYLGFSGIFLLYLPIGLGGFLLFGDKTEKNILDNFEPSIFHKIVNLLMILHIFCAYLICVNPINLDLEHLFKIKHSFNVKRCLSRSSLTIIVIFLSISIPSFNSILNLIGGSTITLVSYILTPLFYLKLKQLQNNQKQLSNLMKSYLVFLVIVGTSSGIYVTYNCLFEIFAPNTFQTPCYLCWR